MSPARIAFLLTVVGSIFLLIVGYIAGAALTDVLSVSFLGLAGASWTCAIILFAAHRVEPTARNLGERAIVAQRDALVATIGAILGINRLAELHFPNDFAIGLLGLGLLLVTAYPIAWLIQWWLGRWD